MPFSDIITKMLHNNTTIQSMVEFKSSEMEGSKESFWTSATGDEI